MRDITIDEEQEAVEELTINSPQDHHLTEPVTTTTTTSTTPPPIPDKAEEQGFLRHGRPETAIDLSLIDLYSPPAFASICFVAINGETKAYCNSYFEQMFFTSMECNHLLDDEHSSPRDIIAR